jgi:hypothetical protein
MLEIGYRHVNEICVVRKRGLDAAHLGDVSQGAIHWTFKHCGKLPTQD